MTEQIKKSQFPEISFAVQQSLGKLRAHIADLMEQINIVIKYCGREYRITRKTCQYTTFTTKKVNFNQTYHLFPNECEQKKLAQLSFFTKQIKYGKIQKHNNKYFNFLNTLIFLRM
ncbi:MAG: hypothetical protein LBE76_09560 [Nitrososphaerota archaeon]|nr:hypothetical protein [Nitrososphaerota archaeon]